MLNATTDFPFLTILESNLQSVFSEKELPKLGGLEESSLELESFVFVSAVVSEARFEVCN